MINELKKIAVEHHVPIICDEGLAFLKNMIDQYQIKSVLEIGTAIGYSALAMASFGCVVDTFERDEFMIEMAKVHFDLYDNHQRVKLIESDALTYQGPLKSYDLIFIDAAKSQYQKFFEKYAQYLNPKGIIICDNLSFHQLDPKDVNRHTRQLIRKINAFKSYLKQHQTFETKFYSVGDGMSLSYQVDL